MTNEQRAIVESLVAALECAQAYIPPRLAGLRDECQTALAQAVSMLAKES